MGDMLDQILMQLQQKPRCDDEDDDESLLKVTRATNTDSVDSLKSDMASPPESPRMSDRGTLDIKVGAPFNYTSISVSLI